MRRHHANPQTNTQKNIAYGLFIGRAVAAGRSTHRPAVAAVRATGEDIRGVRRLLGESQPVFAARFSRTARQLRTWESLGTRFTDNKPNVFLCRYSYREIWLLACAEACEEMRNGK